MYFSNIDRNVITIENININNNPSLNFCPQNVSDNCVITLCLLLCTFCEPKTIELRDCDCFVENGYRQSKFNEATKEGKYNQPRDEIYTHDFSYFAPYGFTDKYYNRYDPVLQNCKKDPENNKKYCKLNSDKISGYQMTEDTTRFVLMTKPVEDYDKLHEYLEKVKIMIGD